MHKYCTLKNREQLDKITYDKQHQLMMAWTQTL